MKPTIASIEPQTTETTAEAKPMSLARRGFLATAAAGVAAAGQSESPARLGRHHRKTRHRIARRSGVRGNRAGLCGGELGRAAGAERFASGHRAALEH